MREGKEAFLKKSKGGEHVCPYSEHCQQRTEAVLFLLHAFQTWWTSPLFQGGGICRLCLRLLTVQEERAWRGSGREDPRRWWAGSMTSFIECRHSERCSPLGAAIYFLALICTPWQGLVKGNNEPLYHPPPSCCRPRQKAVRMMQVWIGPIRQRGFGWL